MTSGQVGGPMQQAVNVWFRWRMAGVMDIYCQYEGTGDQLYGRILSGLHLSSFVFAVLRPPPHLGLMRMRVRP